jgi:hypothetical protein
MNKLLLTLGIVIAFASSGFAGSNDGRFFTKIIHESDNAYTFTLSTRSWLKITNFIQEGGTATVFDPSSGMFIPPTIGAVVVYQGPAGLKPVTVATAGGANSVHEVFISGPVVVTIAPVSGATLYLTWLAGNN